MDRAQFTSLTLAILLVAVPASAQDRDAGRVLRRNSIVRAVERVSPSVVRIDAQISTRRARSPWDGMFSFGRPRQRLGQSQGSGVIIDPKGYVVTNHHVVANASRIKVQIHDGKNFDADLIAEDVNHDLAVIKLRGDGPFPAAALGRSHDLMLGESAIAMGSPFGLEGTVTTGIISAVNRTVAFRGKEVFRDFIQTSAVINPGNSGGPLMNILGEVIGINVAIHSKGPGIGFAIPIDRVRKVVYKRLDPRVRTRATMGFDVEHSFETAGAPIIGVEEGSAAERAGLGVGDVVVGMGGRKLRDWIDFQTSLSSLAPGGKVRLDLLREGKTIAREVTVESVARVDANDAVFALVGFGFADLTTTVQDRVGIADGVIVTKVRDGSSAAENGLLPGDIITDMGGYSVGNAAEAARVISFLRTRKRWRTLPLVLMRDGSLYDGTIRFTR